MNPEHRHLVYTMIAAFEQRQPDARERIQAMIDAELAAAESLEGQMASRDARGIEAGHLDVRAKEHRRMVKALRRIAGAYRHRNLNRKPDEPGPTAETLAHQRTGIDPLRRMFEAEQIDAEQLRAGHEIAAIVRFVTAGIGTQTMQLDRTPGGTEDERHRHIDRMAKLHATVYVPWCQRVRAGVRLDNGPVEEGDPEKGRRITLVEDALPMTMALVVGGETIESVRKRYRVRRMTAIRAIGRALEDYALVRERVMGRRRGSRKA